jgi:hypothetical protein
MNEGLRYCGKIFNLKEIDEIREVIAINRERSGWFISQEMCQRGGKK